MYVNAPHGNFLLLNQLITLNNTYRIADNKIVNFDELNSKFPEHIQIHIGSASTKNNKGIAILLPENLMILKKFPSWYSNQSCKEQAILEALDFINQQEHRKFIIHTESLLIIESINKKNTNKILISKIIDKLYILRKKKFEIIVCLNSIINIEATQSAKQACCLIYSNPTRVLHNKFIKIINHTTKCGWNEEWKTLNTKLHSIRQSIFDQNPATHLPRKSQKVITRLRIGHTQLTHSYLINKEERKLCNLCNCFISTDHLLVHCLKYTAERAFFMLKKTTKELLNNKDQCEKTILFLKKINF